MQNIRVEVTDRDGWRKEFVLQKVINHVGVDGRNDIILESTHGSGVAPRHLQIIASGDTCRVVNVGNTDITIATGFDPANSAPTQIRPLPQLSSTDIIYGAWIKLGDFTVKVRLIDQVGYTAPSGAMQPTEQAAVAVASSGFSTPVATSAPVPYSPAAPTFQSQAPTTSASQPSIPAAPIAPSSLPGIPGTSSVGPDVPIGDSIGLRLKLDVTQLGLDNPIEGSVVVRNSGTRPGAQFKLELIGMDPECYEIGTGPILFPNAEREVPFRLIHSRKISPKAGDLRVIIRATSPDAYPGQVAVAVATIQVTPFYVHEMKLSSLD